MFEKERQSKDVFFSRLSREGKMFLMKDDYDFFNTEEEERKLREGTDEQDVKPITNPCSEEEEPKGAKGFWNKLKNSF